jgi:hypothetical protein
MYTLLSESARRLLMLTAVGACVLAGLLPGTAQAQSQSRWLRTVQVITPVNDREVTGILLDTLMTVIERRSLPVQRSPDDAETQSFSQLEQALLDEGLDVTSATQVFITYRYESTQQGFSAQILDLYFIYRSTEFEEADIPILYLDATDPVIQNIMVNSGVKSEVNEAVIRPFIEQLSINQLMGSTVVKVGERIIRDEKVADYEKRRLMAIIREKSY